MAKSRHALVRCMSPLLGVKRTCRFALHMSAFDPKRTLDPFLSTRKLIRLAVRASGATMRRRNFLRFIGSAAAWPIAAHAQQSERMRRVGVLIPFPKDNPEGLARIAAFVKELQQLGWTDGRNLQIEYRWETGDLNFISKAAAELVTLSPDVIFSTSTPAL